MPLGSRGAGTRAPRTHYPAMQGPDVEEGGGGGGGEAPTAPSNITTVPLADKQLSWGGYGYVYQDLAMYRDFYRTTLGLTGHAAAPGGKYLFNAGGAHDYVVGSASALSGTRYNWQKAWEGLGVAAVNGGNTGLGPFKAQDTLTSMETFLGVYVFASTQTSGGLDAGGVQTHPPLGDWFNDTNWALYCGDIGRLAGFVNFMGGQGVTLDEEANLTGNDFESNPKAGKTQAEQNTQAELRGYQFGDAIVDNHPTAVVVIYPWRPPGSWFRTIQPNSATPTAADLRTTDYFNFGIMRAMAENNKGEVWLFDPQFYKPTSQTAATLETAYRANAESDLACLSRLLPAATRDYIIPRFSVQPAIWCGAPNNPNDGSLPFYISAVGDAGHTGEPTLENQIVLLRKYSMKQRIWQYMGPSASDNTPNTYRVGTSGPLGYHQTTSTPNPPGNHRTPMAAAAVSANHPSTAAPALSASKSGSGSTRTLTATASHPYGIAWTRAYVYPNGTPVYLSGTWDKGGGSVATNFNNSFVSYTGTITATTGQYIIVQAQSIMGHQTSRVLAA